MTDLEAIKAEVLRIAGLAQERLRERSSFPSEDERVEFINGVLRDELAKIPDAAFRLRVAKALNYTGEA